MKKTAKQLLAVLLAAVLALGVLTACGPAQGDSALLQSMGAGADIKNSAVLNAKAAVQLKAMDAWFVAQINIDKNSTVTTDEAIAALNDYANMYNPWDESEYAAKTTYASGGGLTAEAASSAMTAHYPKVGTGKRSYGIARTTVKIKGQTLHVVMVVFEN